MDLQPVKELPIHWLEYGQYHLASVFFPEALR